MESAAVVQFVEPRKSSILDHEIQIFVRIEIGDLHYDLAPMLDKDNSIIGFLLIADDHYLAIGQRVRNCSRCLWGCWSCPHFDAFDTACQAAGIEIKHLTGPETPLEEDEDMQVHVNVSYLCEPLLPGMGEATGAPRGQFADKNSATEFARHHANTHGMRYRLCTVTVRNCIETTTKIEVIDPKG